MSNNKITLEEVRQHLQNCGKSLRASDFKKLLDYIFGLGADSGPGSTDDERRPPLIPGHVTIINEGDNIFDINTHITNPAPVLLDVDYVIWWFFDRPYFQHIDWYSTEQIIFTGQAGTYYDADGNVLILRKEDIFTHGAFSVLKWNPAVETTNGYWEIINIDASDFNLRNVVNSEDQNMPVGNDQSVYSKWLSDMLFLRQDGTKDIVPLPIIEGVPVYELQRMLFGDFDPAHEDALMSKRMSRQHLTNILHNMVLTPGTEVWAREPLVIINLLQLLKDGIDSIDRNDFDTDEEYEDALLEVIKEISSQYPEEFAKLYNPVTGEYENNGFIIKLPIADNLFPKPRITSSIRLNENLSSVIALPNGHNTMTVNNNTSNDSRVNIDVGYVVDYISTGANGVLTTSQTPPLNIQNDFTATYSESRNIWGLMVDPVSNVIYNRKPDNSINFTASTTDRVVFSNRLYWGEINTGTVTYGDIVSTIMAMNNVLGANSTSVGTELLIHGENSLSRSILARNARWFFFAYPVGIRRLHNITADGISALDAFMIWDINVPNFSGVSQNLRVYINRTPWNAGFVLTFL